MDKDTIIDMKKFFKWGTLTVIVLGVFLIGESLSVFKSLDTVSPVYNSIQVAGKGEVVSIPDLATFSFTVSADSKSVSDAQATVTKKIDAILADLKAMGIEDKDIKTTDYSVWPKYSYNQIVCTNNFCPPSRQVADGYTINHSILIKVRKTDDAGKALASVGGKGATNISGLTFTTDNPDTIKAEARAEAIKDARAKAEVLAKNLGVKLVRVVSFFDNSQGGYPIAEGVSSGITMMKASTDVAPTLPAGENKVTANVTVTYEIR